VKEDTVKLFKRILLFLGLSVGIPAAFLLAAVMWVFVPYVLRKV
jgi:hypothetical protein